MPINSSPDALFLPAEDFEDRFGFTKPDAGAEIVFYCKAGIRSKNAAGLAKQAGFSNVKEYPGSWDDWVGNGGEVKR
jgi:rhodanese-related sulfurtransferase